MQQKGMISLICMIIGLVLILIAFFGPWYTISMSGAVMGYDSDSTVNFHLTDMTTHSEVMGQTVDMSQSYDELRDSAEDPSAYDVYGHIVYIAIIAIIFAVLGLIGMLLLFFKNQNNMRMLGVLFGILTFILALIAVAYFMISPPTQTSSEYGDVGFWFSETLFGLNMTGGPAYGWYLMLIGGIFTLISALFIIKKPASKPIPQTPPMQPPQQMPPQKMPPQRPPQVPPPQ
jgi:hypothetical protein